jgi:hypothetical protein
VVDELLDAHVDSLDVGGPQPAVDDRARTRESGGSASNKKSTTSSQTATTFAGSGPRQSEQLSQTRCHNLKKACTVSSARRVQCAVMGRRSKDFAETLALTYVGLRRTDREDMAAIQQALDDAQHALARIVHGSA